MDLSNSDVHVWLQLLDGQEVSGYAALLAADEQARAARFRFEVHRNRYIVGRGRLRQILGEYLEIDPARVPLSYGAKGKPEVAGLSFNLAHSGAVAVYAIARRREIGVDVEEVRGEIAREQIPERFFAANEVRSIRRLPEPEQARAFFRCWSRKEAYVKGLAEGLTVPLNSFDTSFEAIGGWTIRSFEVAPNYIGAVAVEGGGWSITRIDQAIILR